VANADTGLGTAGAPPDDGAFRLPAVIDIAGAAELRQTLLTRIDVGALSSIDAAAVERITTPGVQLLIAAARSCERLGQPFHLSHASEAVTAAFADLGLETFLDSWRQKNG